MEKARTVYSQLSDEEIDARAEFKVDVARGTFGESTFGAFVKRRWWVFSWWELVFHDHDLERCVEHLQTIIQLPRRYTRKVLLKP